MKINDGPTFELLFEHARNECTKEFLVTGILVCRIWGIFENEINTMDVSNLLNDSKDAFAGVLLKMREVNMPYVFVTQSRILFGKKQVKEALEKGNPGIKEHQESKPCLIMNTFDGGSETNLHYNLIKQNVYLTSWISFEGQTISGRFGNE